MSVRFLWFLGLLERKGGKKARGALAAGLNRGKKYG